jgi:hypothetical protein
MPEPPVVPPVTRDRLGPLSPEGFMGRGRSSSMYRPIRNVMRFALFIAVLASLSIVLSTSLPSNTPYVSALSTVSLGADALADPKCNHNFCSHGTFCVRDPSRNMTCTQTGTMSCTAVSC